MIQESHFMYRILYIQCTSEHSKQKTKVYVICYAVRRNCIHVTFSSLRKHLALAPAQVLYPRIGAQDTKLEATSIVYRGLTKRELVL
jgi:hypothetical protein